MFKKNKIFTIEKNNLEIFSWSQFYNKALHENILLIISKKSKMIDY